VSDTTRLGTRRIAVISSLASAALGVAGCGGSTTTSVGTAPTASAAPGPSATPTSTAVSPGHVPASTRIDSAAYLAVLEQSAAQGAQLSPSQAASAAKCTQRGLQAAGFKTQGDSEGAVNGPKSVRVFVGCLQQAKSR
jgi:hypothetical protein